MAATFGTRSKKLATGRIRWYTTLNFDGKKTEKAAGYEERDAYALGLRLCGEYNQRKAGVVRDSKKPFEEAVEAFLSRKIDRKGQVIKENTHELNRKQLEWFFRENDVSTHSHISTAKLVQWKASLTARGLSQNYININLKVVRAFLLYCLEQGWITSNPFPQHFLFDYEPHGHYYTYEERKKLLMPLTTRKDNTAMSDGEIKADRILLCAIKIALHQGIRLSQVWELKLEDFKSDSHRLWIKGIKRKQDRRCLAHPVTWEAMQEAARLNECKPGERIFKNWATPTVLGNAFSRKRERVGVTEGTFHSMKHTAVSSFQLQGLTPAEIEDITNTDPKTLSAVYTHVDKEELQKKFHKFEYPQ